MHRLRQIWMAVDDILACHVVIVRCSSDLALRLRLLGGVILESADWAVSRKLASSKWGWASPRTPTLGQEGSDTVASLHVKSWACHWIRAFSGPLVVLGRKMLSPKMLSCALCTLSPLSCWCEVDVGLYSFRSPSLFPREFHGIGPIGEYVRACHVWIPIIHTQCRKQECNKLLEIRWTKNVIIAVLSNFSRLISCQFDCECVAIIEGSWICMFQSYGLQRSCPGLGLTKMVTRYSTLFAKVKSQKRCPWPWL